MMMMMMMMMMTIIIIIIIKRYQDDIILGGPVQTAVQDVHRIAEQGSRMGLVLNASKCELIADSKMVVADPLLASFSRVEVEESSLLRAPVFPGKTLDEAWSSLCADLTLPRCIEPLEGVFQRPKVQHLLRCSPPVDLMWLDKFDDLLKSSVSSITNNALSETQWLQATLPIIRRVASLALPAFLASAAGTLQLQDYILASTHISHDPLAESLKSRWGATFGPSPATQSAHRQSS